MTLNEALELIGTVDNASGQICRLDENGKPTLILFEFGCPNCSEVANKNSDDYGAALELIVNRAALLWAACQASIDFYAWHMAAEPSKVLEELIDRRMALQKQLEDAVK